MAPKHKSRKEIQRRQKPLGASQLPGEQREEQIQRRKNFLKAKKVTEIAIEKFGEKTRTIFNKIKKGKELNPNEKKLFLEIQSYLKKMS